jgi:amino acid permease
MIGRKEHTLDTIEKDQKEEKDVNKDRVHGNTNLATFFSAYISLTNTVVGSGILGLPYAFSCTGWILGCILLLICAVLSSTSLHLLALCGARTAKPSSFYAVAEIVSPGYTFIIDVAVALKCFGVATSYLIVIGDLMPDVMVELNATELFLRRSTWVIIGWLLLVPLSFLDSLNAFKWTSTVSVIFIGIITCVVIAYAVPAFSGLEACSGRRSLSVLADTISEMRTFKNLFNFGMKSIPSQGDNKCVGNFITIQNDPYKILKVIPIFVFGFTCQQNIFAVTNELRLPTQERISGGQHMSRCFMLFSHAFLTGSMCLRMRIESRFCDPLPCYNFDFNFL